MRGSAGVGGNKSEIRSMKILYLCADPGVPIFGRKGCSTHVRENCFALQAIGHDVKVVCSNAEGDDTDRGKLNVIQVPPLRSHKLGFDLRHVLTDRRIMKTVNRLLKTWTPDAIYERYSLYSLTGTRLARELSIPHLLESNAFMTVEQKDRIRILSWARRRERRIFRDARHVVVVSDPLFKETAELRGGDSEITRMPMAVNLEHFSPQPEDREIRSRYGWDGKFVLGYIGTLTGWHGINLLYGLAEKLRTKGMRDFVIMLVGGDEKRLASHRQKVAERGLSDIIHFLGAVPYQEVPHYIRAMDLALVPDTTYWSSPAKLFEYQGCAVPVLAPRYPAIERAMTHEVEGLLFEAQNIEDMADKVMGWKDNREGLKQMGGRGRQRAETKHSWIAQAHAITDIFERQRAKL